MSVNGIAGTGPVATGGGSFNDPADGNIRNFTFSVIDLGDGAVGGQGQLVIPATGQIIHWATNSYLFDDDGSLIVTGTITESEGPAPPVGWTVIFAVQDNGKDGSLDEMTFTNAAPPELVAPNGDTFPFITVQDLLDYFEAAFGLPSDPSTLFLTRVLSPYAPIVTGNITIH